MLAALWTRIAALAAAAGAFLVALGMIYRKGEKSGRDAAGAAQSAAREKAIEQRSETNAGVDRLGDDDVTDRLRRDWSRPG